MPTSSPQRAIRERRIAVMLSEGEAFQAVSAPAKAHGSLPLALIAVIAVVCGLAVFLILFHRDRALPHARIRQPVTTSAPAAVSVLAKPAPALQTTGFELHRSRRFTELGGIEMRVLGINSRTKSCLLLLRRNRKTSRVRFHPGHTEPITSLGDPHLQLRVESISRTSVAGAIQEMR